MQVFVQGTSVCKNPEMCTSFIQKFSISDHILGQTGQIVVEWARKLLRLRENTQEFQAEGGKSLVSASGVAQS